MITTRISASPSGLFTRAAWERELEGGHGVLPRWTRDEAECRRRYLEWVHAEAMALTAHLGRLRRPGTAPRLVQPIGTLIDALSADAAWAMDELSGQLRHAA